MNFLCVLKVRLMYIQSVTRSVTSVTFGYIFAFCGTFFLFLLFRLSVHLFVCLIANIVIV